MAIDKFAQSQKELDELIIAARRLATESDFFACSEGDRDDLESAISEVERLTGRSK